jgi:hypothetical protein
MSRSRTQKERKRYYLLPGMGGRAYRRRQKSLLKWSVITALVGSTILATLMYWFNRLSRP